MNVVTVRVIVTVVSPPCGLKGLTAVDFTDDSSLIAGGYADSTVRVWSVTPKKLRRVKSAAGTLK